MTFGTKIQTYDGAHGNHNTGAITCAVDWANSKLWMTATYSGVDYLSRYGIDSGVEQAFNDTTAINPGVTIGAVGWDQAGSVYLSGPNGLGAGSLTKINGTSLAFVANYPYSAPNFGGTNIVSNGGGTTIADTNTGNTVINLNNTSYSDGSGYITSLGWPNGNARSTVCPGKDGSGISFLITSPGNGISTQIITLRSVNAAAVPTTVGTYVPTDFNAGWTEAYTQAMCMDQTDGNPICLVFGVGASPFGYVVKFNGSSGAIVWKTSITSGSPDIIGGAQWSQSRIMNSQLAFIQIAPTEIVVMNTSSGAITSTQSTGLNGVNINGQQSYDDTRGAIIGMFAWDGTGAPLGPEPLNGSVAATGWAALYVTESIAPSPTGRRFAQFLGLQRVQQAMP